MLTRLLRQGVVALHDGAEVGMFYNNQSKQVHDGETGVLVIPCFFERCSAVRQALINASSGSSRGGTRLATPALMVR